MMTNDELTTFCTNWLAAWTGNNPEKLLTFYTDNTFYLDPARPQGLNGKVELQKYFTALLAKNPDWVWSLVELHPTEKGLMLKWSASVPKGETSVKFSGLDLVEMKDGKISRNEVYFDPSPLFSK